MDFGGRIAEIRQMKEDRIRVHDKNFRVYLPEEKLEVRVRELAQQLSEEYAGKDPLILSVLNGAFVFTADLIRNLSFDPEVDFLRVSSYHGGTQSSGKVRSLLGLNTDIRDRHVLIVEDIVDTGHTIEWLKEHLAEKQPASLRVAALLFKKEAFQYKNGPEYAGFIIPNEFVVGYGLDYAQRGRFLKSIYKID